MLVWLFTAGRETHLTLGLLTFRAAPPGRRLPRMFFKEVMEVARLVVSQHIRDHADLWGRHPAQQRFGKCKPGIDLGLKHAFTELLPEGAFQSSHLDSQLSCNRAKAHFYMSMVEQNEVLHDTRRMPEEFLVELIVEGGSPGSYPCDHFSLYSREISRGRIGHGSFLQTEHQQILHETTKAYKFSVAQNWHLLRAPRFAARQDAMCPIRTCKDVGCFDSIVNQARCKARAVRRPLLSLGGMSLHRMSVEADAVRPAFRDKTEDTCNSHGHVSFSGKWVYDDPVDLTHSITDLMR